MSKRKQLTPMNVIKMLSKIERGWPSSLSLFANNGLLMLIDEDDNRRIVWAFDGIQADGGDLGTTTDVEGFQHLNTEE